MVVSDHDGTSDARADDTSRAVQHCEVDVESDLLAMMPTVACDSEGEDDTTGGEVEHLGTVELHDIEGAFTLAVRIARFLIAI